MKTIKNIGLALVTGLQIVFKFCLLLPILFGMVWFNFKVDRSGIFQGERFEREVALALLDGKAVSGNEQMDERTINALYVQNLSKPLNTVAFGSSRILQLDSSIAGTTSFYNFGMVGADFKDLLGTFYLLDRADKLPENIIIGLDPWLLNSNLDATDSRSDKELYEEFLAVRLGIDNSYQSANEFKKYEILFSPSYFQGNLEYYFRDATLEKRPAIVTTGLYSQATDVKRGDGSILYNAAFRGKTQEQVYHDALTDGVNFLRMRGYEEPDAELCDLFDTFIQYVQGLGINVVFVMVPYQPVLYSYVTEHAAKFPGFFKTAKWYRDYAVENDIPLYGDYNPYVAGCWYGDYYDGHHIKSEALAKIFPGIKNVLAQQKNHSFPGVQTIVPYHTAEKIVGKLNEITTPQTLVRGEDLKIDGVPCYEILRYSDSKETATLSARYAVSQTDGEFYRYDTTLSRWVIDQRF